PYSDEIKKLSKDDLVHYCMSNNLITNNKRFKFYNKNEIIKLIKKWHSGEDIEKEMNYGLRSLNKTQLITYLGLLDCYYDKRMSNLKLACIIADVDYDNGKGLLNFFDLEELQKVCEKNNISNYKNLEQDKLLNLLLDSDLKKFNISINNEIINIDENILWNKYHADKNEKNNESTIYSNKQNNNKVKTLKDIAGLEEVKKAFNEKIILPIKHADLYRNFNKKTGGGILLFGLPGTGKTLFAEAVSNEINAKFFSIKCSDIKSKWIGESEKKIKDLFKNARKEKIAIIFFDEFESIGKKRSSDDLGSETTVPEILAQMQGVGTDNNNILVIAATNRPWDIDSALLRPGRFDEKIYVPLPDYSARKEIFKTKLKDLPHDDIDFDYLASITNNCNGADISYFCERLKMSAINRSIESKQQQKINKIDIDNVKENFKSSVNLDDLKEMEMFLKN
ncbi:MAG: ATP-binding protein, partial [Malacoplasma sp.]|nr:ATP-binding protein [Malacoplasma sp.]